MSSKVNRVKAWVLQTQLPWQCQELRMGLMTNHIRCAAYLYLSISIPIITYYICTYIYIYVVPCLVFTAHICIYNHIHIHPAGCFTARAFWHLFWIQLCIHIHTSILLHIHMLHMYTRTCIYCVYIYIYMLHIYIYTLLAYTYRDYHHLGLGRGDRQTVGHIYNILCIYIYICIYVCFNVLLDYI